jgi:hypothetical protein
MYSCRDFSLVTSDLNVQNAILNKNGENLPKEKGCVSGDISKTELSKGCTHKY